ncbi:MAG: hypothetical protein ABI273_04505 [Lacunisphaera sp.]
MKKTALFFTLTALISFMGCETGCMTAQRKKPETAMERLAARSPDQIEGFLDKRLSATLDLTSDQLPRVYAIDLDYAMKIQAAAASHEDTATRTRTMDKANDAYSTDLQEVLSADQYTRFLAMKDELRADINNGARSVE